jgi:hypothetical protein
MKGKITLCYPLNVCLVMLALTSCRGKHNEANVETGRLTTTITFESAGTKADPRTTAIPETSWNNIRHVQLFLYDASGVVRFSDVVTPGLHHSKFTWSTIPPGMYTLVAVANARSSVDAIATSLSSTGIPEREWTSTNVRGLDVDGLGIRHKRHPFGFPVHVRASLAASTAYMEPSEIFMAYLSPVAIVAGQTTDLSATPLRLKREVALMRVRVRTRGGEGGENSDINFVHANALLMLYTLPDEIKIPQGTCGGVVATSTGTRVVVVASGRGTFKTADPTTGYSDTSILNNGFTLWRDVIVFPNDGGRSSVPGRLDASASSRYFIVLSGHASQGHRLENGEIVNTPGGAPVYWSGVIDRAFAPNLINEVDLTLSSGGSLSVPPVPTGAGRLEIDISSPTEWSSNVIVTGLAF